MARLSSWLTPQVAYSGFHAIAIGQGSDQVNDYLEKNYCRRTFLSTRRHTGHRMHLPRERGQGGDGAHQGRRRRGRLQEDGGLDGAGDREDCVRGQDQVGQAASPRAPEEGSDGMSGRFGHGAEIFKPRTNESSKFTTVRLP